MAMGSGGAVSEQEDSVLFRRGTGQVRSRVVAHPGASGGRARSADWDRAGARSGPLLLPPPQEASGAARAPEWL